GLFPQTPQGPFGTGPGQTPLQVAPRNAGIPTQPTNRVRAGDLKPGDKVPPGYTWSPDGSGKYVLLDPKGVKVPPDTMIDQAAIYAPIPAPQKFVRDLNPGDPLPSGYY